MQLSMHILRALVFVVPVTFPLISWSETTQRTADYLAVSFEAEDYNNKGLRWVHTRSNTAQQEVDPDGNHSSSASGNEYMEVLPDYRVTHDDPFHPTGSLWNAFAGPELTYTINFPESGRYYAHVRSYSTGSEDNGAHIGLNGDFPPQARRMQWCRGKHQWTWSSAQRDSGGAGPCGLEKTVYLDVPSPGNHQVNLQAREDGVEFDRVVLIKDLSNNTRLCSPVGATQITCENGSIGSADGMLNLRLTVETDLDQATTGDPVVLSYRIENLDSFDHATNVTTELTLPTGVVFSGASNECAHNLGVVTCVVDDLEPTHPGEGHDFEIEINAAITGSFAIDASVTADEAETNMNNNTITANIDVVSNIAAADLSVEILADNTEFEVGDTTDVIVTITNPTGNDAQAVELIYTVAAGAIVRERPDECGAGNRMIVCSFGVLAAGAVQTAEFEVDMAADGAQLHTAVVSSNNELNPVNNTDMFDLVVGVPLLAEETDPADSTEDETDAEGEEPVTEVVEEETNATDTQAQETTTEEADTTTVTDTDDTADTDTDTESTDESDGDSAATTDTDTQSTTVGSVNEVSDAVDNTTTSGINQATSTATNITEEASTGGFGSDNESSAQSSTAEGSVPSGGTAQANSESSGGSGALNGLSLLVLLLAAGRAGFTRRQKTVA